MKNRMRFVLLTCILAFGLISCGKASNDGQKKQREIKNSSEVEESISSPKKEAPIRKEVEPEPVEKGLSGEDELKNAYGNILKELSYSRKYYYWQGHHEYNGYSYDIIGDNKIVAFADVNNDGITEMLLASCPDYDGVVANLKVYTYDSDEAKLIYDAPVDAYVAGGTSYYIFLGKDGCLYQYKEMADEAVEAELSRFVVDGDKLVTEVIISEYHGFEYDDAGNNIGNNDIYYDKDSNVISEDEGISIKEGLIKQASQILLHNDAGLKIANAIIPNVSDTGLIYSEGLSYLLVRDKGADKLPFDNYIELEFSSGAGAWATSMVLYYDGTFKGTYYDADMGATGDGYEEGMMSICNYSGNFKNIKKLYDDTYVMEIDNLVYEYTEGDEWIEDDVLYVATDAYGVSGGSKFYLYLPNAKVSNLPNPYVSWIWGLSDERYLPNFGLYNKDQEEGFIAH